MNKRIGINILLFFLTLITTTLAGAMMNGELQFTFAWLLKGLPFSLTLLTVLGVHETAHFIASKHHHVEATLPYFIPVPPPIFLIGTFGAVIKIKSAIYNRKALFDIGFAGPAAGFAIAVPMLFIGLSLSKLQPVNSIMPGTVNLGDSLIMLIASNIVFGNIPSDYTVVIHPIAFAAWIGLLVTAINLLPVGQLDGGHISYAVFGEKHILIARIFFVIIVLLGVLWLGWILWGLLLLFVLKLKHPPPVDPYTELGKLRKNLSAVAVFIFILTFIPIPFSF
ncbi:site-2 protease family protein [bacterium]|nr:site-2 protease family protein [bacterium]